METAYRRLHRMDEARNAMTTYQHLKDEAAKKSQQQVENFRVDHPTTPREASETQTPQ